MLELVGADLAAGEASAEQLERVVAPERRGSRTRSQTTTTRTRAQALIQSQPSSPIVQPVII